MIVYSKILMSVITFSLLFGFQIMRKPVAKEYLIGKWKITSQDVYSTYHGKTNLLLNLPDCERDDYIEFTKNGIYKVFANHTHCQSGGNEVWTSGTWGLDSESNKIMFETSGGRPYNWTIIEITETSKKVCYSFEEGGEKYIIVQMARKL